MIHNPATSKRRLFIFAWLLIFTLVSAKAQSDTSYAVNDSLVVNADIFEDPNPALVTLKFDIKSYQKKKYKDKYQDADLMYQFNDTINIQRTVRVRARGNFRRRHCSFPPMRLNIRKADIQNVNLADTRKMKVVTHCRPNKTYNNYILKEYLVYKMYNLISPYSFRVRLMEVKYIDTGRKDKETTGWAILIEPEEMLAERLNAAPLKSDVMGLKYTDPMRTVRMNFFQYMIGNADYSITGRHNVKLLIRMDTLHQRPIPVPYDFDYSGFVNTDYAIPGEELGISSVRERYFLGACRTDEEYQKAVDVLAGKKEDIYGLINTFEYMDIKVKKEILSYLDEYYNSSALSNFLRVDIRSTCR